MTTPSGVSIWESDLLTGALPNVCVKSGMPADTVLRFDFSTTSRPWYNAPLSISVGLATGIVPDFGARRVETTGWLPITKRWRSIFIASRVVAAGTAALGVVSIIAAVSLAWPQQFIPAGFALLGVAFASGLLYPALRPRGFVGLAPSGSRYVHLTQVHPNFVAAVQAIQGQAVAGTNEQI